MWAPNATIPERPVGRRCIVSVTAVVVGETNDGGDGGDGGVSVTQNGGSSRLKDPLCFVYVRFQAFSPRRLARRQHCRDLFTAWLFMGSFSRLFSKTASEKQWLGHILCTAYKSQPCEPTSLNLGSYSQGTVGFLIRTGINMGQGKEKRLELFVGRFDMESVGW